MKSILALLLFILAVVRCGNLSNANSESAKKLEFEKLNSALKKYEEPSQFFKVSAEKASEVTGKIGTVIFVNPSDLVTENGKPIGTSIEVELKELVNQSQLLRTGAQTVSDGKLLISGGAYFINMTSDGEQLKLKDGAALKVEFPEITDSEMSLFYGQRDSLGAMNWQQAGETFKAKPQAAQQKKTRKVTTRKPSDLESLYQHMTEGDTLTKAETEKLERIEKIYEKTYAAVSVKSLGWINCDRFPKLGNRTAFKVNFNPADSIGAANIYLVFKDMNSVMLHQCYPAYAKVDIEAFENVPVGYEVRLVAIAVKDETIYSFATDMTIGKMQSLSLPMKKTSDAELNKLFDLAAK